MNTSDPFLPETSWGDLIYFGQADAGICFDGVFRAPDPDRTNTGEAGMFLVPENLIGKDAEHGLLKL